MRKKRSSNRVTTSQFPARLAAYSATALAVTAAAPPAEAAWGNINLTNNFTGSASLSFTPLANASAVFGLGPLSGKFEAEKIDFTGETHTQKSQFVKLQGLGGAGSGVAYGFGGVRVLQGGDALTGWSFRNTTLSVAGYIRRYYSGSAAPMNGVFGPMSQGGTGYLAFKAKQNALTYYGWMRVKVTQDGNRNPNSISFVENGSGYFGAYMSTNDPNFSTFKAGVVAVPEPTTVGLGLLALGALGVRELRRRRSSDVSQ